MKRLLLIIITLFTVTCAYAGNGRTNKDKELCTDESAVNSSFSYDEKTRQLTMSFEEADLIKSQPQTLRHFKKRRFFRVNDSFELPRELCEALGTIGPILIKCGNYPLEYKNGIYTIILVSGA